MTGGGVAIAAATRLARAWTCLYTFGIDAHARAIRRAEIDSDLADAADDARTIRRSEFALAVEIAARVAGPAVIADSCLRAPASGSHRAPAVPPSR